MKVLAPANETDDQHVGIVPMPGARVRRPLVLRETDPRQAPPRIVNVAGGAPGVENLRLIGDLIEWHAVGIAVEDIAATVYKRVAHRRGLLVEEFVIDRGLGARVPVVFQIVDAPGRPLL